MAKSNEINPPGDVDAFIANLEPVFGNLVQAIRETILAAHTSIGEHIKWNSPAFFFNGNMAPFKASEYKRDLLVIHTRKDFALLIFPTGALIEPPNVILEGSYTDGRRMISIKDMQQLELKKAALTEVVQQWIKLVE